MKAPILEIMLGPTSGLSPADEKILKDWEGQIEGLVITTLQLLTKIKEYKGGILWQSGGHKSFIEYLQARFGHSVTHSGRLDQAGDFVKLLGDKKSTAPIPSRESQIRPVVQTLPEEHWVPCWEFITSGRETKTLQASFVTEEVKRYKRRNETALVGKTKSRISAGMRIPADVKARKTGHDLVTRLEEAVKILPKSAEIEKQLKAIDILIDAK